MLFQALFVGLAIAQGTTSTSIVLPTLTTTLLPETTTTTIELPTTTTELIVTTTIALPTTTTTTSTTRIIETFLPPPTETALPREPATAEWSWPFRVFVICLGVVGGLVLIGGIGYLIYYKTSQRNRDRLDFERVFESRFKEGDENQFQAYKNLNPAPATIPLATEIVHVNAQPFQQAAQPVYVQEIHAAPYAAVPAAGEAPVQYVYAENVAYHPAEGIQLHDGYATESYPRHAADGTQQYYYYRPGPDSESQPTTVDFVGPNPSEASPPMQNSEVEVAPSVDAQASHGVIETDTQSMDAQASHVSEDVGKPLPTSPSVLIEAPTQNSVESPQNSSPKSIS
jgi:hypothetical protein